MGYEIKDSWSFNLPENNYLEFSFTDYKNQIIQWYLIN